MVVLQPVEQRSRAAAALDDHGAHGNLALREHRLYEAQPVAFGPIGVQLQQLPRVRRAMLCVCRSAGGFRRDVGRLAEQQPVQPHDRRGRKVEPFGRPRGAVAPLRVGPDRVLRHCRARRRSVSVERCAASAPAAVEGD
eukprot:1744848-Prymnesium_polylepis.1